MQGIAHELLKRNAGLRLAYASTEQFTNEFITAIQSGGMGDFRRRFREIDLLLVDDVPFLKGTESTQRSSSTPSTPSTRRTPDRPDLRSAAEGNPRTGRATRVPFRVGHGGQHRLADFEHRHRHPPKKASPTTSSSRFRTRSSVHRAAL